MGMSGTIRKKQRQCNKKHRRSHGSDEDSEVKGSCSSHGIVQINSLLAHTKWTISKAAQALCPCVRMDFGGHRSMDQFLPVGGEEVLTSCMGGTGGTAPRKTRRPASKRTKTPAKQARDHLLSQLLAAPNGRDMLALLRATGQRLGAVEAVTPPGSFVDVVVRQVREKTDLPPEIAFAVVMSQLAAALAQAGTTVSWPDDHRPVEMAMWMLVLAPSGAGKTLLRNLVADALGLKTKELAQPGSARAFLDALLDRDGTALWVRDEYGQLMRQIADGGPLGPLRDYMLRAYDHGPLEVTTKKDGLTKIDKPLLSIFGSTVAATWAECIDPAMLADGLLARHLFVVAEQRPLAVPRYPLQIMRDTIDEAAMPLRARLLAADPTNYVITPQAANAYDGMWRELVGHLGDAIDQAYVRRVTWSAGRYAVIYHILLDKTGKEIGIDAMRWAWRIVQLHLQYAREVLALSDSGVATRLNKILEWVEGEIVQGIDPREPSFARRLLMRFRRDLRSVSEAKQVIDLARKIPPFGEHRRKGI